RDAYAEGAAADLPAGGELSALLRPGRTGARELPRRPNFVVVAGTSDQPGIPVGGERDGVAEVARPGLAGTRELRALLRPGRGRAREPPRRSDPVSSRALWVVVVAADQRGVAVAGERDIQAE